MAEKYTVSFGGHVELKVEEVWPEGDAPEKPTVADVVAVMQSCGDQRQVLQAWMLDNYVRVFCTDDRGQQLEVWKKP